MNLIATHLIVFVIGALVACAVGYWLDTRI